MVYIVLGKGFEEVGAVTPGDLLRRAGIETAYVGIDGLEVTGAHGIGVRADLTPEQMDLTRLDMIVLPGGLGGVASIRGCRQVMDAVLKEYFGVSLAETNQVGLSKFIYWAETDSYYVAHTDTRMTSVTLTGGERAEDGTVTLRYDGGVIVLIHHDGHDTAEYTVHSHQCG